jgi:ATP-dependent Clp protease adaptor protein ClpS
MIPPMAQHDIKNSGDKSDAVLVVEPKTRTANAKPPFYKVLLMNDDYTPMDFVVFVLKEIFHKSHADAIRIMLEVHNRGAGTCGVFTRDVAETKVEQVVAAARKNEHPLQCVMEKE